MTGNGIPFNRPYMTGRELEYIAEAHANGHLSGDGPFTKRCHAWLERTTGTRRALLTHSCTGALEMFEIKQGPYSGENDKTRFPEAAPSEIRIKGPNQ